MKAEFDIAICGAGLVGLALANALRDSDLRVALIDPLSRPKKVEVSTSELTGQKLASGYTPKVSALNIKSMKFLSRLGIWSALPRPCAFSKMLVRDSRGSASIEFSASDIHQISLGYIVENQTILFALAENLNSQSLTSLKWESKLEHLQETDRGYSLALSTGEEITCRLLVGADGGNSRIRQLCKIRSLRWSYGQQALVTTIQTEKPHGPVARQWFTSDGPLAFLPLNDPHLCSIVWSVNEVAELETMTHGDLCQRLTEASEAELGRVVGVDARFAFPLNQQHSLRYVKQNMALIGDAAHTIHPLAGQGANLGFADAEVLGTELVQYKFKDQGIGDLGLLKRYESARQPHNLLMTSIMEIFKRLYSTGDPATNWLRNTGMKFVNENALLKSMIMRLVSGL